MDVVCYSIIFVVGLCCKVALVFGLQDKCFLFLWVRESWVDGLKTQKSFLFILKVRFAHVLKNTSLIEYS